MQGNEKASCKPEESRREKSFGLRVSSCFVPVSAMDEVRVLEFRVTGVWVCSALLEVLG
jgi:hypothetical protein